MMVSVTSVNEYSYSTISDSETTVGCSLCNRNCIYAPNGAQTVLKDLQFLIANITSDSLRDQLVSFCSSLSNNLVRFPVSNTLPTMVHTFTDDGLFLEWIFDYYRFGFDFYTDISDSGWFVLVMTKDGMFRYKAKFNGSCNDAVEYVMTFIRNDDGSDA